MHRAFPRMMCAALATTAATACTDTASSTDLHPEGPPMIEQVRLIEIAMLPGISTPIERTVFAFGTHPQATENEQHPVTNAKVVGNKMRIIFDALLRGNHLQEIECRRQVDEDVYARVPVGATPDDIARCAVAEDVLPRRCPGSDRLSVCVCQRDDGCGMPSPTPKGEPVGVLDNNQDGAADRQRFVSDAVVLSCGGAKVTLDLANSYWTPSGNQEKPAQGGFDALGPAIVLVANGAYPTGSECGLVFSPEVVDKDGNMVCAPPDGDRALGCSPGDTSAVTFSTEPLQFNDASGASRAPWPPMMDVKIQANAPLEAETLVNITMTEGAGTPFTQFTATLSPDAPVERTIVIHATAGFAPSTPYTITVPTTVADAHQKSAPQPFVLAFTTAAN